MIDVRRQKLEDDMITLKQLNQQMTVRRLSATGEWVLNLMFEEHLHVQLFIYLQNK